MDSTKKNSNTYLGIVLMLLSALLGSLGQLAWKIGANGIILFIALGFLSYALGVIFMIAGLKYGELSVLYPILSFSYIMALIFGKYILNEAIPVTKILGIVFLIIGLIILNLKNKEKINGDI